MYNPDNFPLFEGYELDPLSVLKVAGRLDIVISKEAKKEIISICNRAPLSEGEFVDILSVVVACSTKPVDLQKALELLLKEVEVVTQVDLLGLEKVVRLSADVYRQEFNLKNCASVPHVSKGVAVYVS